MTLRARLLSLTLSMVAIVAVTLIALDLNSLAGTSLDVAIGSSEMAARQIQSVVRRKVTNTTPLSSMTLSQTKALWMRAVAADRDLAALLEGTMAQSSSIVEINIAGEDSIVLAASNPRRRGPPMTSRQDLHDLRDASPLGRITAIWKGRDDYETRLPLGIGDQAAPLFTIQILVAPALLRDAMLAPLRNMAAASGIALLLAFFLAYWSARVALRPLARISHLIDDIAGGRIPDSNARKADEARELVIIESKLNLLGERFRGATKDLEGALARLDAGTRRHIEDQLALARRLTAINSLTSRVAHEIKNPLNSIALRLEVLRGRVSEEAPDTDPEFAILSEEVVRLDRVVRTFLDFNRPVELRLAEIDLRELMRETLQFLVPEAAQRGIDIVFEGSEEPLAVRADSDLLRQALLNISVNAIEAMEKGGKLRLGLERHGDTCVLHIADTGTGIPREQLDKIFQLYFTTKPKGSGIGLAMTFRAVQLHGGTIEVESVQGKGTTFFVKLPLAGVS
jgi:signal transduction histidine kinase